MDQQRLSIRAALPGRGRDLARQRRGQRHGHRDDGHRHGDVHVVAVHGDDHDHLVDGDRTHVLGRAQEEEARRT